MNPVGLVPSTRPALIDASTDRSWTARELLLDSAAVADEWGGPRRLVLILAGNTPASVLAYVGALARGDAVCLVDERMSEEAVDDLVGTYRPDVVVGPSGTAARLASGGADVRDVRRSDDSELLLVAPDAERPLHPDLAVLLTTSGTTGSRKLVRLSASNIVSNAASIAEYLELGPSDRSVTSLPFHYSFGLSVLNSHWFAQGSIVLTSDSVLQRTFWSSVRRNGVTTLAGVPYTYAMLERVGFRDMDLPSLTSLQQAGGALDVDLAARYGEHMAARGGRFFVMYGQTEATARIAYVPPERLPGKPGSAGIAIPGGRLTIAPAAPGETDGEVVYEGPNVMLGYAEDASDLARGDECHGVLRTGDLGRLDADGFLFLTGRSRRIAKIHGMRVNLDEVEKALRAHGPVAVVAGPDAIRGLCAFGDEESLRTLARELAQRYRLHHSTIDLVRVDEIPVTGSGKTDYARVGAWTP